MHVLALLPTIVSTRAPSVRTLVSMAARIEVEKKFAPPDMDTLSERIASLGGTTIGEKSFTDVYYDTADCALTRRDMWLRCRDDEWELKLPVTAQARRSGGENTVFREVEGAAAVSESLRSLSLLPGANAADSEASISDILKTAAAMPIIEITTRRSKWQIESVAIDADCATYGHSVMELEVMVNVAEEVAAAEEEIARVAALLGATPLGNMGGKVETYIRRFCPSVCSQLIEAGILKEAN